MSKFIPVSKSKIHQTPGVEKFKKSILIRLATEEYYPLIQTQPDKTTTGLFDKEYDVGAERYYIVQFDRPATDSRKYELEDSGARIFDYFPDFSFIVKMDDSVCTKVRSLEGVRWVGHGRDNVLSGYGKHSAGSVLGNGVLSGSNPAARDYDHPTLYIGIGRD